MGKRIKHNIIIVILIIAPLLLTVSASDFENHWSAEYIQQAIDRKWISGYPDGSFRPDNNITRAEFSTMLWDALDLDTEETVSPFKDVSEDDWFCRAAAGLYNAEIVSGYGNGIFAPNDMLTREMAFTMLANAFQLTPSDKNHYKAFSDSKEVSSWASAASSALTERGYVSGQGANRLAPKSPMTRGEMAAVLVNIYDGENMYSIEKDRITFSVPAGQKDYIDLIQRAFDTAAEKKLPLYFKNPSEHAVYNISKTLIIPDGLEVNGGGATIAIDSNHIDKFLWAQEQSNRNAMYREFGIMNEGMISQADTTFSIDNLNFTLRYDHENKNLPVSLIGLGYMKDVDITNSTFSTYSEIQKGITTFDAYTNWQNLNISGCTFNVLHEGDRGGVWLRTFYNEFGTSDAVVENCVFNNKSADEVLAVFAQFPSIYDKPRNLSNVTVKNNEFYNFTSEHNNPAHLITLGNTGNTDNVVFEDNYIHMEAVWNSVIKMSAHSQRGTSDNIIVKNNTIEVDDVLSTSNQIITGDSAERNALLEGNKITVNSKSGILKNGVTGEYTKAVSNTFSGNGFDIVFSNVRYAKDNTIEQCNVAFTGVLECLNNEVKECNNQFVITTGNYNPSSSRQQDIVIEGNSFKTSNRAYFAARDGSPLYCNLILRGNTIDGGGLRGENTHASALLIDNTFNIRDLNELKFIGGITSMSGNRIRDFNGNPLITQDAPPQGISFNESVAVGVTVDIESRFIDNSSPVTAYEKVSEGSDAAGWKSIYKD